MKIAHWFDNLMALKLRNRTVLSYYYGAIIFKSLQEEIRDGGRN